jgi:hypothetical protein
MARGGPGIGEGGASGVSGDGSLISGDEVDSTKSSCRPTGGPCKALTPQCGARPAPGRTYFGFPGAAGAWAGAARGAGAGAGARYGTAGRIYDPPEGAVRMMRGVTELGGGAIQPVTAVGSVTAGAIVPRMGLWVSAWTG